jgi:hypothetical protein
VRDKVASPFGVALQRRPPARSPIPVVTYRTVDEFFARLRRAGWSVGDVRVLTAAGPAWLVTGTNGENALSARGRTQGEAWWRACEQAQSLGMLRWRGSSASLPS